MKRHAWDEEDNTKLLESVYACKPLFDHYVGQGKSYTGMEVWDAIAGRLLPDICVTGKACKRQFDRIKAKPKVDSACAWDHTIALVESYDRDMAETTFDGVAELLGNMDALFMAVKEIKADVARLEKLWE